MKAHITWLNNVSPWHFSLLFMILQTRLWKYKNNNKRRRKTQRRRRKKKSSWIPKHRKEIFSFIKKFIHSFSFNWLTFFVCAVFGLPLFWFFFNEERQTRLIWSSLQIDCCLLFLQQEKKFRLQKNSSSLPPISNFINRTQIEQFPICVPLSLGPSYERRRKKTWINSLLIHKIIVRHNLCVSFHPYSIRMFKKERKEAEEKGGKAKFFVVDCVCGCSLTFFIEWYRKDIEKFPQKTLLIVLFVLFVWENNLFVPTIIRAFSYYFDVLMKSLLIFLCYKV